MKTSLVLALVGVLTASTRAELFRPETVQGAVLGGIAGAVIGNNSGDLHHNGARGAAIGALAGGVIGAAMADQREAAHGAVRPTYPRSSVSVSYGDGRGYWGRPYAYRARYGYPHHWYPRGSYWSADFDAPAYGYTYDDPGVYSSYDYNDGDRPSHAFGGALLGGIAGAIIGNNSGNHNGWQGAAIGAGAGLLLGSLADEAEARSDRVAPATEPVYAAPAAAPATSANSAPQNVTILHNYNSAPSTSMSAANSLYGR